MDGCEILHRRRVRLEDPAGLVHFDLIGLDEPEATQGDTGRHRAWAERRMLENLWQIHGFCGTSMGNSWNLGELMVNEVELCGFGIIGLGFLDVAKGES